MVAGWPKWLKDYNNTQGGSCWAGAPGPPIPLISWPRLLECMRATCSHELRSSITGSTSSSVQPQRYSVSIPSSSLSPVKPPSFRENAGVQATRSDEPFSSTTGSTGFVAQPQRYSVSTPPSISPVKSSSFRDSAGLQETHSHKLGSSATGSTSSGMQLGRHSVSLPSSPPPVKTSTLRGQGTEAHPSTTKNVQNRPSRHLPYKW